MTDYPRHVSDDDPIHPFVPRYGERSLADLTPSILAALDVPGVANVLGLDPVQRACLLVIDGLGFEQLLAAADAAPFLSSLAAATEPLTAGFPATTATSLASLGTGLTPGEHAITGYTIALPGEERALNCLRWAGAGLGGGGDLRRRLPPEEIQPQRTIFERAATDGIDTAIVSSGTYEGSGFSRAVLRGGRWHGSHSLGDQIGQTLQRLEAARRSLVYVYHPELDVTGHLRGVGSAMWHHELAMVDHFAQRLAQRLPRNTLLCITADHGMVDVPVSGRIDLADHPELRDGVRLLAGEGRARHVHTRNGATGAVLGAWRAVLGDSMWIASRDEAIAAGWFGPSVAATARSRIGDVVAAARTAVCVTHREVDPGSARLVGQHGSMTSAEQLVPCLLAMRGAQ